MKTAAKFAERLSSRSATANLGGEWSGGGVDLRKFKFGTCKSIMNLFALFA